MQFAARFDLTLDADTARSAARIRSTTCPRSASGAKSRSCSCRRRGRRIGLALALDLGVVARLFPELQALVGCEQEPEWHPEGDVWVHTLMVVDQARTRSTTWIAPQQITVMLGAVCHDLGKPPTTRVHRRTDPLDRTTRRRASSPRCGCWIG